MGSASRSPATDVEPSSTEDKNSGSTKTPQNTPDFPPLPFGILLAVSDSKFRKHNLRRAYDEEAVAAHGRVCLLGDVGDHERRHDRRRQSQRSAGLQRHLEG